VLAGRTLLSSGDARVERIDMVLPGFGIEELLLQMLQLVGILFGEVVGFGIVAG
jgi:hypothetical protein